MKKNIALPLMLFFFLLVSACTPGSGTVNQPTGTSTPLPITPTPSATAIEPYPAEGVVNFRILHWNDFHAQMIEGYDQQIWVPGAAYLSGVVKAEEQVLGSQSTLILDAGDWSEGARSAAGFKGKVVLDFYEWLGVDAATIGNHELFNGVQNLFNLQTAATTLRIISINFQKRNAEAKCTTEHLADPYAIFVLGEEGGPRVRVAVIGVGEPGMEFAAYSDSYGKKVCFSDAVQKIIAAYDQVKNVELADVVVLLTHNGFDGDKALARELMSAGKPADIIIGGHSHTWRTEPLEFPNTWVVTAGDSGRAVGIFDLTLDRRTGTLTKKWKLEPITSLSPQDPAALAWLETAMPTQMALRPATATAPAPTPQLPDGTFLVNLEPVSATVGYWTLGEGIFTGDEPGVDFGTTINSHGLQFPNGLFASADSRIEYQLEGQYKTLRATVMLKDSMACGDGAAFIITLDGVEIFHSRMLLQTDSPEPVEVDVRGGNDLVLETLSGGNIACDATIWGDPYLVK